MRGPKVRPTIPDIPQPSSRTVALEWSTSHLNSGFEGAATHEANSGVIFQTTRLLQCGALHTTEGLRTDRHRLYRPPGLKTGWWEIDGLRGRDHR
jgi:hypothetical protein